jgi:hypothetical protein
MPPINPPTLHDVMSQTDFSPFAAEDSMPAQLDAIRARLDEDRDLTAERFRNGALRMGSIEASVRAIEKAVAENTVITRRSAQTTQANADVLADIRQAQVIGRTVGKVVMWFARLLVKLARPVLWLGMLAGAGTAIYAAWYQATHGGKLP